jgi:hypothetical protein
MKDNNALGWEKISIFSFVKHRDPDIVILLHVLEYPPGTLSSGVPTYSFFDENYKGKTYS